MNTPDQRATEGVSSRRIEELILTRLHDALARRDTEEVGSCNSAAQTVQMLRRPEPAKESIPNIEASRLYRERRMAERREQDRIVRRREYFTQSALIGLLRGRGDEAIHPEAFAVAAVALADATIEQLETTR